MTDFLSGGAAVPRLSPMFQFWLGYIAILVVPGPNSFLVATVSAARGLRGVVPLILAISLGAASLVLAVGLLMISTPHIAIVKTWMPQVSALMMLVIAWRILTLHPPSRDPIGKEVRRHTADVALGFTCGLTNPISALYFTSQLANGGPLSDTGALVAMGASVAACSLIFQSALASILSLPSARAAVQQRLPALKICVATIFGVMSLRGFL